MGQKGRYTGVPGGRGAPRGQSRHVLQSCLVLAQPGLVEGQLSSQRYSLSHIIMASGMSHVTIGNACQLIHIIGLGSPRSRNAGLLTSEIRRRRLWACYLMHCFSSEKLFRFNSIADIQALALPWPEPDFRQGASKAPSSYLNSKGSSRSIFAELIRGLTLW